MLKAGAFSSKGTAVLCRYLKPLQKKHAPRSGAVASRHPVLGGMADWPVLWFALAGVFEIFYSFYQASSSVDTWLPL